MGSNFKYLGHIFSGYRLQRPLGSGGFGTVYLGEHLQQQTLAAVKLLPVPLKGEREFKDFINEARTIRLQHPHIIPLLDFGIGEDDLPFLVMEYAPEGTLRDRYPKGTKMPLATIVTYVSHLASALQYAHDMRLIHRDIKPENMLLRADGSVVLSDFGLARMLEQSALTSQLGSAGTPAYLAPEQSMGQPTFASDQYALGVVVYEWLCGERPFRGAPIELIGQHALAAPPPLSTFVPDISPAIEGVVLKALAKNPRERWTSVQDFAKALAAACSAAQKRSLPVQAPLSDCAIVVSQERLLEMPTIAASTPDPGQRDQSERLGTAPTYVRPPAYPTFPPQASGPITSVSGQAPAASDRLTPPPQMVTPPPAVRVAERPQEQLQPPRRRYSRRVALGAVGAGIVGVGATSGVLIWLFRPQPPPVFYPPVRKPRPALSPASGTTLYTYHSQNGAYALAWSPDGTAIASASDVNTIQVWNSTDGKILFTYQSPGMEAIRSIGWSPDGKYIAFSGLGDNAIDIWDATTGKHVFTRHDLYGGSVLAWSPDSTLIASGGSTVNVWKAITGESVYTYPGISGAGNLTDLAWSPDGKRVVSGYLGNVALVWDATSGDHVLVSTGYIRGVLSVAWSPNGQYIATGAGDATAHIWEAATGKHIYTYTGHTQTVEGVAWSPDGKRIASASDDKTVHIWDATTGEHVYVYQGHTGFVSRALWSPDGRRVASVSGDETVQVWSAQ